MNLVQQTRLVSYFQRLIDVKWSPLNGKLNRSDHREIITILRVGLWAHRNVDAIKRALNAQLEVGDAEAKRTLAEAKQLALELKGEHKEKVAG